ncbi:MAG: hypothetical protein ACLQJ0_19290 [Steroidobacteraceae bacterium]|jgi:hypothetical protein
MNEILTKRYWREGELHQAWADRIAQESALWRQTSAENPVAARKRPPDLGFRRRASRYLLAGLA